MHRIGRTGRFGACAVANFPRSTRQLTVVSVCVRAGTYGVAINLVNSSELELLRDIQQQYACSIERLLGTIPEDLYRYDLSSTGEAEKLQQFEHERHEAKRAKLAAPQPPPPPPPPPSRRRDRPPANEQQAADEDEPPEAEPEPEPEPELAEEAASHSVSEVAYGEYQQQYWGQDRFAWWAPNTPAAWYPWGGWWPPAPGSLLARYPTPPIPPPPPSIMQRNVR